MGWKISVLSSPLPINPTVAGIDLFNTLPAGIDIFRVKPVRFMPSNNWFPRIDGGFIDSLNLFSNAKVKLRSVPPSVILATGPPFLSFVAAYYLSRYFKAKFVLDYRDEWTECPFDFVSSAKYDRYWERRCLKEADVVIFTTKSHLDHALQTFKELKREKCSVIPNGWEPADFSVDSDDKTPREKTESKFHIAFVGNLGRHTLPERFLSSLEKVLFKRPDLCGKIFVQFVGNKCTEAIDQLSKFSFPMVLNNIGLVPKKEANRIMRDADALLIFNEDRFARYLPGKLYDYLAAGPPILCLGDSGEIADLIRKFDSGMVLRWDSDTDLEQALDLFVEGNTFCTNRLQLDAWLSDHTRESMAINILERINRCL
jgi:glycosyltransferase involved in cell wall biosynthesis